jgi:opacity protein-like surface antigen
MRALKSLFTLAGIVLVLAGSSPSIAQQTTNSELDNRLARLEAENAALKKRVRIEALERENAALRRRLGAAGSSASRVSEPTANGDASGAWEKPTRPEMLAYARATPTIRTKEPLGWHPIELSDPWSGGYWGVSFGAAEANAKVEGGETYVASFPTNAPPFVNQGVSNVTTSTGSNNFGALIDLSGGFNTRLTPYIVAGVQVEGSLADVEFNSEGTRAYTYFNDFGPTGQTGIGDFRPHVHAQWMVSILGRAGILIDPFTLAYVIGGLTEARFDYSDITNNTFFEPGERFWALGWNVGGGVERKINPSWSVRAEYRYTHFSAVDVSNNFLFVGSFPDSQTNALQTRFSNNMHVARLGIAYLLPSVWP